MTLRPGSPGLRACIWREATMCFMVEIDAGIKKANAVDASGGPGAMLAKLGGLREGVTARGLYCRRPEIAG
jgi:hypothetical protein